MKLFEDEKIKSVQSMSEDELHNVVAMLRDLRARAVSGATRSIKQRVKKDAGVAPKKRLPKMMDINKITALLSSEDAKQLMEMLEK